MGSRLLGVNVLFSLLETFAIGWFGIICFVAQNAEDWGRGRHDGVEGNFEHVIMVVGDVGGVVYAFGRVCVVAATMRVRGGAIAIVGVCWTCF